MKTAGLTGGIACGKSTVAALLRARGVPVLDADQVARDVVARGSEGLALVIARFGPDVHAPDGSLDRRKLREIVSASEDARRDLEAITHPRIWTAMETWLDVQRASGQTLAVVEAALMVETGSYRRYDAVIVVVARPEIQLRRLMARDGMDEAAARRFIATQMPVEEKAKHGTIVIDNSGEEGVLEAEVDRALAELRRG